MTEVNGDELVEVRDQNGFGVGRTKLKSEVHRDGDWHRAVHVWIVTPDRRVLLQQRAFAKENHPGMWDVSAAGHIAAGEKTIDAALREVREELGLELTAGELRPLARIPEEHVLNDGRYIDREIHEIYVVLREIDPASLVLQESEVAAVKLVPHDELCAMFDARDPSLVPHWREYAIIAERL
jgi:isopentenyl-diphosphate delta-isomerase